MICEACRGSGVMPELLARTLGADLWRNIPCPECNGCGIASCCDAAGSAQPVPAWPYFIVKERRDGGDGVSGDRHVRRLRGGG
jgi:DnaJ-class molecular chaperone